MTPILTLIHDLEAKQARAIQTPYNLKLSELISPKGEACGSLRVSECTQEYLVAAANAVPTLCAELRAAIEVIRFYGSEDNYFTNTVQRDLSSGFGSYDIEASKVSDDDGDKARTFLDRIGERGAG